MRKLGWMLIVLPFLVACGGGGNEGSDSENGTEKLEPQSAEARRVEISEMESDLLSNKNMESQPNRVKADLLVKRYRDYLSMNPRDSISAEYLFKAADLSIGIGNYDSSIKYLSRLTEDFPQYDKIVEIWLFKGFVFENYMNNHAEAVSTYKRLIEKFPNHRLAKDAQSAIDNFTLTEEELLEKFKAMNSKPES
jgi:tetratricopeptide (TPR) repeat protein